VRWAGNAAAARVNFAGDMRDAAVREQDERLRRIQSRRAGGAAVAHYAVVAVADGGGYAFAHSFHSDATAFDTVVSVDWDVSAANAHASRMSGVRFTWPVAT